jgi:hypothetical protein
MRAVMARFRGAANRGELIGALAGDKSVIEPDAQPALRGGGPQWGAAVRLARHTPPAL